MRKLLLMLFACSVLAQVSLAQDTLWVRYDNRFKDNKSFAVAGYDSVEFRSHKLNNDEPVLRFYSSKFGTGFMDYKLSLIFGNDGVFQGSLMFHNPGRFLYKPSTYSNVDYTRESSRWCFKRSMESEHFVVFWEKGFGDDPTKSANYRFDPVSLLNRAETYWNKYVDDLGFLVPGQSTTDKATGRPKVREWMPRWGCSTSAQEPSPPGADTRWPMRWGTPSSISSRATSGRIMDTTTAMATMPLVATDGGRVVPTGRLISAIRSGNSPTESILRGIWASTISTCSMRTGVTRIALSRTIGA